MSSPVSGDCSDRISSLPDDVLAHMLSFLPTKSAVSTGILSTRWRYLFTLTTCLAFDDASCFSHPTELERTESTQKFKEFVDSVLKSHQISPIEKFSLLCGQTSYTNSELNRWVGNALQKGVQELHYELPDNDNFHHLPDGFFVCKSLTNLKLIGRGRGYNKIQIPASPCLPKLKILRMDRIIFFDFNSMERLFSSCELLEELSLKSCVCDVYGHAIYRTEKLKVLRVEDCCFPVGAFEIDAPNLAYLSYHLNIGVRIVPSWKFVPSFVKAELTFKATAYDEFGIHEDSTVYELELLKAAAYKTTGLRFEVDAAEILLTLGEDEQMPDFHCLSRIHLNDCPYSAWKYLTSLFDKSPQLETLVFESGFHCCKCSEYYCPFECYCDSLSPSDIPMDPFSCDARVIVVDNFCRHKGSMLLMGYLLKNASALEKLIIYRHEDDEINSEVERKISQELLMLPSASKDFCLEIKQHESSLC